MRRSLRSCTQARMGGAPRDFLALSRYFALAVQPNRVFRVYMATSKSSVLQPGKSLKIGGRNVSRPAFWRAYVVEEPRLHAGCCADIGARHRREHGDLQRNKLGSDQVAALSRRGAARERLGDEAEWREE